MATRLTRAEQVERNRERVIDAAREVFLDAGYTGATLDAIAEHAGFSKGVVYSQFTSKADLFLVLLERRITERAEQNRAAAASGSAPDALAALIRIAEHDAVVDPTWQQVLVEFRAATWRDEALRARYAAAHDRAVTLLADTLASLHARAGITPIAPPRALAELVFAIGIGVIVERAASRDALPSAVLEAMLTRAFGLDETTR